MRYDNLSKEDKARVDFLNKLECEGGIEAMWRWGGFKGAPQPDDKVWADLKKALTKADELVRSYARLAESVEEVME